MSSNLDVITGQNRRKGMALRYAGSRGKTIPRLILVLASIAIGLSLGEMSLRAFHLGSTRSLSLYHGRIFKLTPHMSFMNYHENQNLVVTNNLGFHDRERQATNDNYRILVLGDSFVEGRQVKTESLFTSRLEKKLVGDGKRIEVINGGVEGTGTPYQYVLWEEFFEPSLKVDHLVLCFFMGNDLLDNNRELAASTSGSTDSGFFVDGNGTILEATAKPGLLKRTINSGRDHSVLFNTLYEGAYRLRASFHQAAEADGAGAEERRAGRESATAWKASEQGTIALLRKWKRELAGKKVPFDLVMIDRPGRLYNRFELEFIDDVTSACAQEQIGFLRLQLAGDPYEWYSFDGFALGHFNDKGHEAVASELHEYFQTHYQALSRPEAR
jgi:lysophospholipase L1-like esterase